MYVDARFDRKSDTIQVVERVNGERKYKEYPARYTFYYDDPKGKFRSIHNEPVTRVACKNTTAFRKEKSIHSDRKLYESDINPINQCLSENYLNSKPPSLNVCFWDIETAFCPTRGFSPASDPFTNITAISLFLQWQKIMITIAVIPETLTMEQAKKQVEEWEDSVFLFDNEKDMLIAFLDIIEDADVLSGWNCSMFDIPYTVNRITEVLSKNDTRRMCLWNQFPRTRTFERFGKEQSTYVLSGRVNLDYLDLYKKYTYEERSSYKLDFIGEIEVNENKTEYEGTLDSLYKNDFRLFIKYSRQDVFLLDKLDKKFGYIDLTISSAHENTVLMPATLGSVAIIEQGIINEAHLHGMVIPDKKHNDDNSVSVSGGASKKGVHQWADSVDLDSVSIAGGYVGTPKKGLHEWIGSIDLNSLYPSIIRSLNMGTETVVGQVRQDRTNKMINNCLANGYKYSHAWEEKFSCIEYDIIMDKRTDENIIIDWENGSNVLLSGAEAYNLIFNSNKKWMLSSNATIFSYETRGIIPDLLTKWYMERKQMQRQKKNWQMLVDGITLPERLL